MIRPHRQKSIRAWPRSANNTHESEMRPHPAKIRPNPKGVPLGLPPARPSCLVFRPAHGFLMKQSFDDGGWPLGTTNPEFRAAIEVNRWCQHSIPPAHHFLSLSLHSPGARLQLHIISRGPVCGLVTSRVWFVGAQTKPDRATQATDISCLQ